jgi:hypothetical protein
MQEIYSLTFPFKLKVKDSKMAKKNSREGHLYDKKESQV